MKTVLTLLGGLAAGIAVALLIAATMNRPGELLSQAKEQTKNAETERDRLQSELDNAKRDWQATETKAAAVVAERDEIAHELANLKAELAALKEAKEASSRNEGKGSRGRDSVRSAETQIELPDVEGFDLTARYASLDFGEARVEVSIKSPLIYLPLEGEREYLGFTKTQFFVGETKQPEIEGFYKIDGKAEAIEFSSSNEAVMSVDRLRAKFKEAGEATLSVSIAGKVASLPISVVRFPIRERDSVDFQWQHSAADVIKLIGLPDKEKEVSASWPGNTVDGIYYQVEPLTGFEGKHWRYNRFPGLLISIKSGGRVHGIYSSVEDDPD